MKGHILNLFCMISNVKWNQRQESFFLWGKRFFKKCPIQTTLRISFKRGRLLLWALRGKRLLCAHNPQTRHRQGTGCTALTQTFISFNNQQYCGKTVNAAFFELTQVERRSCFSLTKKTGAQIYLHLTTWAARAWNAAIIWVVLCRKKIRIFGREKKLFC